MTMGSGFQLLRNTAAEMTAPVFNPRAKLPVEPMAKVKAATARFLLAGGEQAVVGRIYEMPTSLALDLVVRGKATLLE